MRILICGINYSPELIGTGKFTGEMGRWLASEGHEVRVVTAPPYYPAWKVSEGYSGRWYRSSKEDDVRICRCPLWVPRQQTGLKRILHLMSFAISCFPVCIFHAVVWRPDVVLTIAPAFMCAPGGWIAARLAGAHASLHIQDFEVDAAFELGLLRGKLSRWMILLAERTIMRRFDSLSTISGQMIERLKSKGLNPSRLTLFRNWVDLDVIKPGPRDNSLRQELGFKPDDIVALYSGNMGEKQGLDLLIEAAKLISKNPKIKLVLCGEGGVRARLEQMAINLPSVSFLPLQPISRYNDLLNAADIHLVPQRAGAADLVMPSKLTGILASGGALIAMAQPGTEIAKVLEQAGGILCPPEDVSKLASEILQLAENIERREEMKVRARNYAVSYLGRESILSSWAKQLNSRLGWQNRTVFGNPE